MAEIVPFMTGKQIKSLNSDQIKNFRTQMGEITFDEVVQLNILRERIAARSTHLSVADRLVVTRPMQGLEAQIFATDSAVSSTYPVAPDSIAVRERAPPVKYNKIDASLAMAETRWFISDDAKLRGAWQWTVDDTRERAAQSLAVQRDNHVLTQVKAAAPAGNDVAAANTWDSANGDVETDIAKAIAKIVDNSDITQTELEQDQAFAVVMPAKAYAAIHRLKLIRNINDTVKNFIQTEYKVRVMFSRKPRNDPAFATWPIATEAIVTPIKNRALGFLGTFDGGGAVPAQIRKRLDRGEEIINHQWFKYTAIPQPFDGTVTTNALIAKITAVVA